MIARKLEKTIIAVLFVVMNVQAQDITSPIIHPDGSVTFLYYNPDAKNVKVVSDCLRRRPDHSAFGEKTRTEKMTCDSLGIWSLTTRPLLPEVYSYNYIVDGTQIPDPSNADSAYVLLHKVSHFAIGGTERTNLYLPAPADKRGHIDSLSYYSEQQGITRRLLVYVPNGCNEHTKLPVLFLLHGVSGDELSWLEHGKATCILDNLTAQGKIPPMLVVMPDCNVVRKIMRGKRTNILRNMFNYPALCRGEFERDFHELEDFVASRYNISPLRQDHAIAGLSSGARQAANIAKLQPDTFATVALFCPVVHRRQIPDSSDSVYQVYVGTDDMFYNNGKNCYRRLKKNGVNGTLYETQGGHTWRSWREFLTVFLPTLFSE